MQNLLEQRADFGEPTIELLQLRWVRKVYPLRVSQALVTSETDPQGDLV